MYGSDDADAFFGKFEDEVLITAEFCGTLTAARQYFCRTVNEDVGTGCHTYEKLEYLLAAGGGFKVTLERACSVGVLIESSQISSSENFVGEVSIVVLNCGTLSVFDL